MSSIHITNIKVNNPKDYFQTPIRLSVDLEVFHMLSKPFEFQVIYIGSADDPNQDQVLQLTKIQPMPIGNELICNRKP